MSDVHQKINKGSVFYEPECDLTIIAGDIENPQFLNDVPGTVLAVLGNHDYYGKMFNQGTLKWWGDACPNTTIMEKDVIDFGDTIFLGTTLWSNPPVIARWLVESQINDFRQIGGFSVDAMISAFQENFTWLRQQLEIYARRKVVVVTHFMPADFLINSAYVGSPLNSYFSAGINFLGWEMPDVWIYGHTHTSKDVTVGKTRFICNPMGYGDENPNFEPDKIIMI